MKFKLTSTAGILNDYTEHDAKELRPYGFTFGELDSYGRMRKLSEGEVEISTLEELI